MNYFVHKSGHSSFGNSLQAGFPRATATVEEEQDLGHFQVGSCRVGALEKVHRPYKSLIEALYTRNSPPVVSFNQKKTGALVASVIRIRLARYTILIFPSTFPSTYLSILQSIYLPIYPSIYLPIYLSLSLSVCLCLSVSVYS